MKRYFQISCHALVFTAFLALSLTGRLDLLSIVVFSFGMVFSLYRTVQGKPPLLTAQAAFYLSCAYVVFFLIDSAILSRSFIPATIHMVLFLELAKLYQEKTDKDYLYLIILAFLKILAASSLTIDMSFGATLLLFLIALVSTLMSFEMHRAEGSIKRETQHAAATLGGMSVWAALWIIVLGVGLFFVIPRVGTGYFSRAATSSLLVSGFTESVQLGEIGQVKLSSAVVMHAQRLEGVPHAVLKWRGVALDMFDGRGWHKSNRMRRTIRLGESDRFVTRRTENSGERARYNILLEPLATTALFGPHRIYAVSGRLPGIELDNDDSIYMRFQQGRRVQYEVWSEIPAVPGPATAPGADQPPPPEIAATYLQLPQDFDSRITELAGQITASGSSVTEKAILVEAHLKKNYQYTLNLTWQPGTDPVSTFLFDVKSGHCEYFASAMAILLRTAGIPTRLVNGFLMGEYNPVGDSYIIRQSDAHTWVEVYVPEKGWLEFDPTPPNPNDIEMSLAKQLSHYVDAAELFWNSYLLTYDTGAQLQLFNSAQDRVQTFQTGIREHTDSWASTIQQLFDRVAAMIRNLVETVWFWSLGIVVFAIAAAYRHRRFLAAEWQIWNVRKGAGVVDGDVIEHLFYRAARVAERRHAARRAGQTWREWIFGLPDSECSILGRALEVFEKSKYGRAQASAADCAILKEAFRELRGS